MASNECINYCMDLNLCRSKLSYAVDFCDHCVFILQTDLILYCLERYSDQARPTQHSSDSA